ncbi:hypothetical protein DSO57_1015016 [Entomophthora muscae]|uniref:Uncharacterized protein n=1 Tax=Entomophthora muscae TaxID=34485 RepID=A0ACC2S765_9FUNG|nr:hypothetical protein DSO57_1015016 [Entomophthora muscae]
MDLNPWTPLASSQPTPNLAKYVIPAVMLLYLAGSLRKYKILVKAFCQAINLYPIVYALNSFEPPDLPSYVSAPYRPFHFTEYPPNPDYLEFTLEENLIYTPEARTRETELIGHEETWITVQPLLFYNKYNYLSAYLVPMTHPLTPRPNCPQEFIATCTLTATFGFGLHYSPHCTRKSPKIPAKLLDSLEDLAHTVDKRFVLAYPMDPLALVAPSWEEMLINLDYLLAWCHPLLKTSRNNQSRDVTSMLKKPDDFQMPGIPSSQSGSTTEIKMKLSSLPGPDQQKFSTSQLDSSHKVM